MKFLTLVLLSFSSLAFASPITILTCTGSTANNFYRASISVAKCPNSSSKNVNFTLSLMQMVKSEYAPPAQGPFSGQNLEADFEGDFSTSLLNGVTKFSRIESYNDFYPLDVTAITEMKLSDASKKYDGKSPFNSDGTLTITGTLNQYLDKSDAPLTLECMVSPPGCM